jgi:predicted kinase
MRVLILSGIPGSGKSTYVKSALVGQKAVICSADTYFTRNSDDGTYKFDPSKLGLAHGECLKNYAECIRDGSKLDLIVVDNTNTSELEIAPYVALAAAYGVEVDLVTLLCDPSVAHARNVHGVPLAGCQAMDRRIRDRQLPPFWNITQTTINC